MLIAVNAIITAMVAVSFGNYASAAVSDGAGWTTAFAILILPGDGRAECPPVPGGRQSTDARRDRRRRHPDSLLGRDPRANLQIDLLAFSGFPSFRQVVSSVALKFFAFLCRRHELGPLPRRVLQIRWLARGSSRQSWVVASVEEPRWASC